MGRSTQGRWGRAAAIGFAWILALPALAATLPEGMSLADTPAWVDPIDVAGIAPAAPSGGVAYRVVDDQISLRGARPHEYRLLAYDVVDRTGLEDAGRLRIGFQPDFQSVQLHGLQVIRDGERSDRRGQARVELLRLEERANDGILDGWRTAEILIPDVKVGDRVELSFSTLGSNPVLGDHYHRTYSAAYATATGMRRLRVLGGPAKVAWRQSGPVTYRATQERAAEGSVLELVARDVPAIEGEADAPEWFDGYGELEVGTAPDWGSVVQWASNLFKADPASRERLAREVAGLDLAGKPEAEVVAAALDFVQREVRYVSLSIGDSSHAPADPAVTLERRYGDCKDKSLLLVGLLAEAGVEAQPVLVNTQLGRRVGDRLPGPNAFDHAIVRARVDGQWLYVDPTRNPELGTFADRSPADFGQGLPVARGVAGLEAFPEVPPTPEPAVEVRQDVKLAEGDDGRQRVDIQVETLYRYGHAAANRSRFAADGAAKVGRAYLDYMEGFYRGIEQVSDPVDKDSPADNRFEVREQYRADLLTDDIQAGQLGEFNLVLFQLRDWVPAARAGRRAWPLHLPGPSHGVQEIRMTTGGGWDIEPEQHTVENDYFRFDRTVSAKGSVMTIRGEWRRKSDAIVPEDYAAVREQLAEVHDLLDYPVVIGGETPGPEITRRDLAWPGLSLLLVAMLLGTLWTVRDRSAVAGVFFTPRTTMQRLLGEGSVPMAMLWLLGSAVLMLAMTALPELVAGRSPEWGMVLLESMAEVPRYLLVAALLMVAFRLLGHKPAYRGLVIVSAWSAIPAIVLLLLGMLAAGPLLSSVAEPALTPQGDVPVMIVMGLVAALMVLAAFAWWLVSGLSGLAEAAGSGTGTAFAALFLTMATLFAVVFVVVLIFLIVSGQAPGLS